MTRQQLRARLDKAWIEFKDSFAGLSASELTQPGVTRAWSVKDIIAHVTTWEEEALKHLPSILKGKRPPLYSVTHGGIDAFNAEMTKRNAKLSLTQVLRRSDATHGRLIALVERVSETQIVRETRFRKRLRLDTYSHYPIHAKAIRKWRGLP